MRRLIPLSLIVLAGCAWSGQKFIDDFWEYERTEYDSDGNVTAVETASGQTVEGKNRTVAPPFQSKAVAGHNLDMHQEGETWSVKMGSKSDLEGGDISAAIEAAEAVMMDGALKALRGGL